MPTNTGLLPRFTSRNCTLRIALLLGLTLAYTLAFMVLYSTVGPSIAALSMLIVAFAAQFFGVQAGLVTVFLSMVLNTFLFHAVDPIDGWGTLIQEGIPAAIAMVLIAVVVGRLHDLTSRLHEELIKRKQAEAATLESEERFRQLSDTTFEAILIHDQGTILEANQAFCRMLGYDYTEVIGRSIYDMAAPEYRERLRKNIAAGTTKQPQEGLALRTDGSTFLIESAGRPITYRGKAVRLMTIHDISERRRAEVQRLELAVAEKRKEVLTEFISTMSHDLKTPLSIIMVNVNLLERQSLRDKSNDSAQRDHAVQVIKTQAQRLGKLIQDILTISELDAAPDQTLRLLDINQLVRNAETNFRSSLDAKQLAMQLALDPTIPRVLGDEENLYRALVNLVENAINYTPNGGAITIRTFVETDVIIEIIDTGIGIEDVDLPHIFDAFYRADKARSAHTGGTGLGLAIVKKIVEMQGSTVTVRSSPGKGSIFRVSLPASTEIASEAGDSKVDPRKKAQGIHPAQG